MNETSSINKAKKFVIAQNAVHELKYIKTSTTKTFNSSIEIIYYQFRVVKTAVGFIE